MEHSQTDNFEKAAGFLIKCWQGHGFRSNGYKVGWKNDVQGREKAYALWNWYRLPEWIIEIAERLRKVQIENRPAAEVKEQVLIIKWRLMIMSRIPGIFCLNSDCKHYFEDNCMKMLKESTVNISESGKCRDFEKGEHWAYKNYNREDKDE